MTRLPWNMERMVNILTERKVARRNALNGASTYLSPRKPWVVGMKIDVDFVVQSLTTVKKLLSKGKRIMKTWILTFHIL